MRFSVGDFMFPFECLGLACRELDRLCSALTLDFFFGTSVSAMIASTEKFSLFFGFSTLSKPVVGVIGSMIAEVEGSGLSARCSLGALFSPLVGLDNDLLKNKRMMFLRFFL